MARGSFSLARIVFTAVWQAMSNESHRAPWLAFFAGAVSLAISIETFRTGGFTPIGMTAPWTGPASVVVGALFGLVGGLALAAFASTFFERRH